MKGNEFIKQVADTPPFDRLHPLVAAFFANYLANEKIIEFRGQHVLNTHFPPYPGAAFDNMAEHFNTIGDTAKRRLFSVSLGVTNRCNYRCWHCYNANRGQEDIPLVVLKDTIQELQALGAVMVTLTGGEPLLRGDLEEIVDYFDDSSCLVLNTTGDGFSSQRARSLKKAGLFAAGLSLDSMYESEHDRLRGREGAYKTALEGLANAGEAGLYPYLIALATREFLQEDSFLAYMEFARDAGALEVHLIEPAATGRLAGREDITLSATERTEITRLQAEVAEREDLPILSSFTYLESPEAFGCGAGLTHLYIDGSGEVCPCNLVPLSFGSIVSERFQDILAKMSWFFKKPRSTCIGRTLSSHIHEENLPAAPALSASICSEHLPQNHSVPRFFEVRSRSLENVGIKELESVYDGIHEHYDRFWLTEAGRPVTELVENLDLRGDEFVFEAGCGTGFATVAISEKLMKSGRIEAVDISAGMIDIARERAKRSNLKNISFVNSDALAALAGKQDVDIIFSSWVLGYIKMEHFFKLAAEAMDESGRLAFIVHKDKSPREPLEIFSSLVARNPKMIFKRIEFDFPKDTQQVAGLLEKAGLKALELREGKVVFDCDSAESALEHLLKSGAGTAYYEAVDPACRGELKKQFVEELKLRHGSKESIKVIHDYIACIAGNK